MKLINKMCLLTSVAMLSTIPAYASVSDIKTLADKSQIEVTGTVETIQNEREFTLRDETGSIDVDIESNQSVILQEGAKVTVKGSVDRGIMGTDINATSVTVQSSTSNNSTSPNAMTTTSASGEEAKTYTIQNLPNTGFVKLNGTVNSVKNQKEFTLKDATGKIDIVIESNQSAALTPNTEVTVVGYIDKGLLSKSIKATQVNVKNSPQ
ncbi:MAG: NirD/YgiW/YdeI family stress tolerance protein [Alphaproteobacteria bacterium]|nr:NirD/YgiW/YdeI family stress tolerance protein [Alphaproteobacteria bacterium]